MDAIFAAVPAYALRDHKVTRLTPAGVDNIMKYVKQVKQSAAAKIASAQKPINPAHAPARAPIRAPAPARAPAPIRVPAPAPRA